MLTRTDDLSLGFICGTLFAGSMSYVAFGPAEVDVITGKENILKQKVAFVVALVSAAVFIIFAYLNNVESNHRDDKYNEILGQYNKLYDGYKDLETNYNENVNKYNKTIQLGRKVVAANNTLKKRMKFIKKSLATRERRAYFYGATGFRCTLTDQSYLDLYVKVVSNYPTSEGIINWVKLLSEIQEGEMPKYIVDFLSLKMPMNSVKPLVKICYKGKHTQEGARQILREIISDVAKGSAIYDRRVYAYNSNIPCRDDMPGYYYTMEGDDDDGFAR